MKTPKLKQIALSGAIAAVYAALTVPLGWLASASFLQIRPAEALTILPALFTEAVPGITIGCALANMATSGAGVYDIVFGSLITLIAAVLTRLIKNPYIAALPPVVLNAALLPLIWLAAGAETGYFYSFLSTLATQCLWVYGLGLPLYFAVRRNTFMMSKSFIKPHKKN